MIKRSGSQVSSKSSSIQPQSQDHDSTATTQQRENKRFPPLQNNKDSGNTTGDKSRTNRQQSDTKMASASAAPHKEQIPHVVRVTFLGVAGILSSPLPPAPKDKPSSILFPSPSELRIVATVSRTRTARGIPSGMSRCLERPGQQSEGDAVAADKGDAGEAEDDFGRRMDANDSVADVKKPTPPSRLMLVRDGGGDDGGAAATAARCSSFSLKLDESQGSVEITASSDGIGDNVGEPGQTNLVGEAKPDESAETTIATSAVVENKEEGPERYVAVWEQDAPRRKDLGPSKTNTLAFEAELHPSRENNANQADHYGSSTSFGTFAPKTFCVSVGLVPDYASEDGMEEDDINSSSNNPSFAIPLGFANLVITGEETLDGNQLQLDLPLTSLNQFIGNFGNDPKNQAGEFPFPLLDLGNGVTGGDSNEAKESESVQEKSTPIEAKSKMKSGKTKPIKKSMVSRIFSRNKQQSSKNLTSDSNVEQSKPSINTSMKLYSGPPLSIFQLGRPPNAAERSLFLQRYNIDPSGDAVIRIGIEVFQRGSELEKIFRQRNRMRREQRRREAAAAAAAARISEAGIAPTRSTSSFNYVKRTTSTGTGRSLVDDEDIIESESDSEETQSFLSLDSEQSGTTWDESTFYTQDTLGSYYSETDTSYSVDIRSRVHNNSVFGRMFDCKLDGVDRDMNLSIPRSHQTAGSGNKQILQSIMNLNCAVGGGGPHDFYDYDEVPRGMISAPVIGTGSGVTNLTPMAQQKDDINAGMELGRQGSMNASRDHSLIGPAEVVEGRGNAANLETTIKPTVSEDASHTIERTATAVTVGNEESPMALIVQRAPQFVDLKDRVQSSGTVKSDVPVNQSYDDEAEGLELTLEELSFETSER